MAGQGNLVFAPQLDPRLLPKGNIKHLIEMCAICCIRRHFYIV